MKTLNIAILILSLVLLGCKTEFAKRETASSTSGNYVPIAGGTMTGALYTPSNGLTVGSNQLSVRSNRVGINTGTPNSTLSVNGDVDFIGDLEVGGFSSNTNQDFSVMRCFP